MSYMKLLLVNVLSIINFLSHGMEVTPTQKVKKSENIRLLHAAVMGNNEAVIGLLRRGIADINAHNLNHSTPLQCACVNNHTTVALTLIGAGADVNNVDKHKETALVSAVNNKNIELVNALIRARANINVYIKSEIPLLRLAFMADDIEIVKTLIDNGSTQKDGALLLASTLNDTSCYCYQCQERKRLYVNIAKLLIKSDANVNVCSKDNYLTPLILACFADNTDVALALLQAGAHVNAKDKGGDTAFMGAVKNKNVNLIYALIKAGAQVNVYDIHGIGALIAAIQSQRFEVIMAILNPTAKLQVRKKIETLLMVYNQRTSLLSSLPQEILKIIITFAHPEFAMDRQLLGEIDALDLVDAVPLELLGMFVQSGILSQDDIISMWHEKIIFLVQALNAQKGLSSYAIQHFESDALANIILLLTRF